MTEEAMTIDFEAVLYKKSRVYSRSSNRVYGKHTLSRYAHDLANTIFELEGPIPELAIRFAEKIIIGYDRKRECLRPKAAEIIATEVDGSEKLTQDYANYIVELNAERDLDELLERAQEE